MNQVREFLSFVLYKSADGSIAVTVQTLLLLAIVFIVTFVLLKLVKKLMYRKLNQNDISKFDVVFSFLKYIVYSLVIILTLDSVGIKITAILLGSTAIFVGIGLGLQQLFQDIISGIFILTDKTVVVDDIIEIDGKIGKIKEIRLRTTRAETNDNKVLIIPNHVFLSESLYNWTQNGTLTREAIVIYIPYDAPLKAIKKLLIELALAQPKILKTPKPSVSLEAFDDKGLRLKLAFTINDSFEAGGIKSALRYSIYDAFMEKNYQFATTTFIFNPNSQTD